jgi:hypothetical protein
MKNVLRYTIFFAATLYGTGRCDKFKGNNLKEINKSLKLRRYKVCLTY